MFSALIQLITLICFYFIGIGLTSSEKEFLSSAVSSPVPSYMYNVPNTQGLNDVADSIMVMLCDGTL